jgi:hypothetical protein
MSSRTQRKLIGIAPDGTEVSMVTSGHYDTAGIVKYRGEDSWTIVEKGTSHDAVYSRTRALHNRSSYSVEFAVVTLVEDQPQAVKDYFGLGDIYRLRIKQVFSPATGWISTDEAAKLTTAAKALGARPSRKMIRWLKRDGWTSVGIGFGNRVADFETAELARIDRRPALGGSLIGSPTR